MKIALVVSLLLIACGSGEFRMDRQVRDEKGNVVALVSISQTKPTVSDVEKLVESTVKLEEIQRAGDIASQGLQRGFPVMLNTPGAQVSAGYSQNAYGYGPSGFSSAYDPLIEAERISLRGSSYGQLPPLTEPMGPPPVYGQPQTLPPLSGQGKEACPPNGKGRTDGERITCQEEALKSMAELLIK